MDEAAVPVLEGGADVVGGAAFCVDTGGIELDAEPARGKKKFV